MQTNARQTGCSRALSDNDVSTVIRSPPTVHVPSRAAHQTVMPNSPFVMATTSATLDRFACDSGCSSLK